MQTAEDFNPLVGVPEDLGHGIRRVLAPNPSPMTFRGTNTYLIGTTDLAVIDPGPDDPAHLQAILRALRPEQNITHIFVTHFGFAFLRAPGEVKKFVQQPLHISHILLHLFTFGIVQQGQAELKTCKRCTQVMADPGQHQGTLLDLALDTGPHIDKGIACSPNLDCTRWPVGNVTTAPKCFGRSRKPGNRTQLVAQIQIGNYRHHNAKKDHVHQQLMRIACRYPPSIKLQLHSGAVAFKIQSYRGVIG